MNREDIKKYFPDATDETISELLNQHHKEMDSEKKKAEALKAKADSAEALTKELETLKTQSLTAEEKLQQQLEAAAKAEKNYKKLQNRLSAEKHFVGAGLKDTEYADILENIVSDNADFTEKAATTIVGLIKAQKDATEKALRAELMRDNPRPGAGTNGDPASEKALLTKQYSEAVKSGKTAEAIALKNQLFKLKE